MSREEEEEESVPSSKTDKNYLVRVPSNTISHQYPEFARKGLGLGLGISR
jgi:hypothetical protein